MLPSVCDQCRLLQLVQHSRTLVPIHEFATDSEVKDLEEKYSIFKYQLPKISSEDPAVQFLGAKIGDVLKVKRESPTAGEFHIYRTVVP